MRLFNASLALLVVIGVMAITLPAKADAGLPAPPMWQLFFAGEFNTSNALTGWNVDSGDGDYWIDTQGGFLHLESNWGQTYPMVWRNDLYHEIDTDNLDYAIEVRFRRTYLTAYGSAIGVGTTSFSGARYTASDPYPLNNYENVLTNEQHQPIGQFSGHERICLHQPGMPIPVDYTWHVGRAEFIGETGYHYFDGSLVSTVACHPHPLSTYFGNPYVQSSGSWSSLDIAYLRIYILKPTIYLPFILR